MPICYAHDGSIVSAGLGFGPGVQSKTENFLINSETAGGRPPCPAIAGVTSNISNQSC